jgi:glycerol-3-phosphate acyltransferase PlsY
MNPNSDTFTPLLRIAAWIMLAVGVVAFLAIAITVSGSSSPGPSGAAPPSIIPSDPRTFMFVAGLVFMFQALLLFALLMVIASMADNLQRIRENTEQVDDGKAAK